MLSLLKTKKTIMKRMYQPNVSFTELWLTGSGTAQNIFCLKDRSTLYERRRRFAVLHWSPIYDRSLQLMNYYFYYYKYNFKRFVSAVFVMTSLCVRRRVRSREQNNAFNRQAVGARVIWVTRQWLRLYTRKRYATVFDEPNCLRASMVRTRL